MRRDEFYRDARDDVDGPLHGIRVLDVTRVWAGPLASCVLADMGADVIRVELAYGRDGEVPPVIPDTGLSWLRETVNRNKRSVGLDLRTAPETFLRLVAGADVVVENYRPGTLDAWGVGYRECHRVKPDIIVVSVSGWGQYGHDVDRPAYDPVVQAASGWMSLNGNVRAPTFLADELAGLYGAMGALAALAHRNRTGEGQHVDVSMLDAMLASSCGLLTLAATGAMPRRWGNETDFVVPSNVYTCRDGSVYLTVAVNRQWRSLAGLIGRPELARAAGFASNTDRLANRDEINRLVAEWCRERAAEEVVGACRRAGVVAERIRTLAEVAPDPHVRARDMLQPTVLHNGTTAPLTGPAVKFSRTPTRIRHGAPAPGADSASVLECLDAETRI